MNTFRHRARRRGAATTAAIAIAAAIISLPAGAIGKAIGPIPMPGYSFIYNGELIEGTGLEGLTTADGKVKVTVERKVYEDYDAAEWVLWFENVSNENSGTLSEIWDCDYLVWLPVMEEKWRGNRALHGEREVISMRGPGDGAGYSFDDEGSALEFSQHHNYFHPNSPETLSFACSGGRSSDGTMPVFEVTQDGHGAIILIGWSGGWKAEFNNVEDRVSVSRDTINETTSTVSQSIVNGMPESSSTVTRTTTQTTTWTYDLDNPGGVQVRTGLENAEFYLKPGEKVRTSSVLVMNYRPGDDSANKFRGLLRSHINHKAGRENVRDGIFAFELWGGLPSEETIRRVQLLKDKDLPFEDLWLDAGWSGYGKKCDDNFTGDWGMYNGDFNVNSRVHPNGLGPVSEAAATKGMRLMLWYEPERIAPAAKFASEHPGWIMKQRPDEQGGMLNLADPEVSEYLTELLSGYIKDLNLSCYRQDFNISPTPYFMANDEPDRTGITEIRHITAMYEIWDRLLEKFPDLIIDNCASGGRRIDLETLKRSIPFFRSDYQCNFNASPEVIQAHNSGISRYFPFTGCTTKSSDEYALRSSFSSSYGVAYYNAIFQRKEEVDWDAAVRTASEYVRIRPYLSKDFHNLGSVTADPTAWAVWQYHDPESGEGVLVVFRRPESPASTINVSLGGLPSNARIELENITSGKKLGKARAGSVTLTMPEPRSSAVITYKSTKPVK